MEVKRIPQTTYVAEDGNLQVYSDGRMAKWNVKDSEGFDHYILLKNPEEVNRMLELISSVQGAWRADNGKG